MKSLWNCVCLNRENTTFSVLFFSFLDWFWEDFIQQNMQALSNEVLEAYFDNLVLEFSWI